MKGKAFITNKANDKNGNLLLKKHLTEYIVIRVNYICPF